MSPNLELLDQMTLRPRQKPLNLTRAITERPSIMENRIGDTDADIEAKAETETETLTGEDTATATEIGMDVAIGHQERDTRHAVLAQGMAEMTGAAIQDREVVAAKKSHKCLVNYTEGAEIGATV